MSETIDIALKPLGEGRHVVFEQAVPDGTRSILIAFERATAARAEMSKNPFTFGYCWGNGDGKWDWVESLSHEGGAEKEAETAQRREIERCWVLIDQLPAGYKTLHLQVFVENAAQGNVVEGQVHIFDRKHGLDLSALCFQKPERAEIVDALAAEADGRRV